MPRSPAPRQSRSTLLSFLNRALDRIIQVFADPAVPTAVRLACWRDANSIMDDLHDGEERIAADGRSRRR